MKKLLLLLLIPFSLFGQTTSSFTRIYRPQSFGKVMFRDSVYFSYQAFAPVDTTNYKPVGFGPNGRMFKLYWASLVPTVSGTTNRVTSTGGLTPVIDISPSYIGQSSITTFGNIVSGTLGTGSVIGGTTMTLGSDASFDIYYRGSGGVLTRLANGTTGNFLGANTGAAPSWQTPAGGSGVSAMAAVGAVPNANGASIATTTLTLQPADGTNPGLLTAAAQTIGGLKTFAASIATPYVAKSANYTLTGADQTVNVTTGSNTQTLPTAVGIAGREYNIKNTGAGTVTIATTSSQTIDGAAPGSLIAGAAITVKSDGANWIRTDNPTGVGLTNPMTTIGDIIQGTTAGAPARLASVATGNALISGGVGAGSTWGKVALTTHVSGTLPVGNGGLGVATTPTNGTIPIGNGTNYVNASITGTANRITVTPGSGSIVLNGPQDIATTSNPQFAGVGFGVAATAGVMTSSVSAVFNKGVSYGATSTITDGATVTFDCSAYSIAKVTLAGNRTLAISNAAAGQSFTLEIIQDATGSRTITLPATCKVANGGANAITLTTTAGAIDIFTFWYDGTSYFVNYGKNYN